MTADPTARPQSDPTGSWKWWICGLLLLATMINYMDRLTLNQTAKRVMDHFEFQEDRYGRLEGYFGAAFAIGALGNGWLVDRFGVRLIYPTMVFLWSVAGFLTGYARSYEELVACRVALGLFESANWPCALKAIQAILAPGQRTLGNGILQSGAALGAIITPQVVLYCVERYGSWREPFLFVGAVGAFWVVLWLAVARGDRLSRPAEVAEPAGRGSEENGWTAMKAVWSDRRFWVLAFTVIAINLTWHFFRAWMPLYMQKVHNYDERTVAHFTTAYYVATDIGSLTAGFAVLWLIRRGLSVHGSRLTWFFCCAMLTLLSVPIAFLDTGPLLMAAILVLGFGSLGVFPNYYALTQDLTSRHQGKLTGSLSFFCWMAMAAMQLSVGELITQTGSYTLGVAVAGVPPILAFLVIALLWKKRAPAPAAPAPVPAGGSA